MGREGEKGRMLLVRFCMVFTMTVILSFASLGSALRSFCASCFFFASRFAFTHAARREGNSFAAGAATPLLNRYKWGVARSYLLSN